jgi:hypothetical protein
LSFPHPHGGPKHREELFELSGNVLTTRGARIAAVGFPLKPSQHLTTAAPDDDNRRRGSQDLVFHVFPLPGPELQRQVRSLTPWIG